MAPYLRHMARRILLDHLNDSSGYEVVAANIFHHLQFCCIGTVTDHSLNVLLSGAGIGPIGSDRPSKDPSAKRKRSRTRLQLVLCDDWHGNTGCFVTRDLALLTKVRTLIHEEISLLSR
jgi:hypothetical protein